MRKRPPMDQRIFFPWERRGGVLWRLKLHRLRPLLFAMMVLAVVLLVGVRERRQAGIRQTRAILLNARAAVDAYMADHDGSCPPSFEQLVSRGHLDRVPADAWGRPLRLVCPDRREGSRYDLFSDGPDGLPGGLDRIE